MTNRSSRPRVKIAGLKRGPVVVMQLAWLMSRFSCYLARSGSRFVVFGALIQLSSILR